MFNRSRPPGLKRGRAGNVASGPFRGMGVRDLTEGSDSASVASGRVRGHSGDQGCEVF